MSIILDLCLPQQSARKDEMNQRRVAKACDRCRLKKLKVYSGSVRIDASNHYSVMERNRAIDVKQKMQPARSVVV